MSNRARAGAALVVALLVAALVVALVAPPRALDPETATIFVSVPSYRDALCKATLESMFANARNPARVFAGVYEQNGDDPAEACVVDARHAPNVRTLTVPASRASGPCTARYHCSTLLRSEEVYMQVDSHTEFAPGWDVLAVRMLRDDRAAREGRKVISTYPVDCKASWADGDPAVIDKAAFNGSWIIFNATVRADARSAHVPSRQIGGGFLLCVSSVVRRVAIDPGLAGLFNNEELLYTARLFTHGIDVVAPTRNLVCHRYAYAAHRTVWSDNPAWNRDAPGNRRADGLLRGDVTCATHGMGTARSLDAFWRHIGVDYATKAVAPWGVRDGA